MVDRKENKLDEQKQVENADQPRDEDEPIEVVPVDIGDHEGEEFLLEEETALDNVVIEEGEDAIVDELQAETEDDFVEEDFAERQNLASGRDELQEELEAHQGVSPDMSADDVDAAWEDAIQSGEETVGGHAPTPDQDQVDEIGEAMGITYEDEEPLHTEEKLQQRDRERWELNPASDEQYQEEEEEENE